MVKEYYYRIGIMTDPEDENKIVPRVKRYEVLSHTDKGVWISTDYERYKTEKTFILSSAFKQWASPTIEEAFKQFIRRRKKLHQIIESKAC